MMEYKYGSYGVQVYGGFFVDVDYLADMPLVGSSIKASTAFCGVYSKNLGCLNGHFHNGKDIPKGVLGQHSLDGKIHGALAMIFPRAWRCTDPLCPECCLHWAKLQCARAIRRFERFELGFPDYELRHVTVSTPDFDYHLSFKDMRKKAMDIAQAVGVVGGVCIYHPKRYSRTLKCWGFRPHFHIVGYVRDGFLDGFLIKRVHNFTGYVVKNLEKRKSVYNTLMYQLSHAGVPFNHQHAVVWFGECGANKLKRIVSDVKFDEGVGRVCPVCGEKLVHVCRVAKSGHFDYGKFEEQFVLDDMFNWVKVDLPVRSRCYEKHEGENPFYT